MQAGLKTSFLVHTSTSTNYEYIKMLTAYFIDLFGSDKKNIVDQLSHAVIVVRRS